MRFLLGVIWSTLSGKTTLNWNCLFFSTKNFLSRKILSHLSQKKNEQIYDRELMNYSEERNDNAKVSSIPYFRVKLWRTIFIVTQPRQKPREAFHVSPNNPVYFKR